MKIKVMHYGLWVISFLITILITHHSSLITVYATDATPSSSILSKLDELKKEIASKAAQLKLEVNKKLQNKAYVGIIKNKSSNSLTVAENSGSKIINVNQDTVYSGTTTTKTKGSTKKVNITLDNLKEEDPIAALGDIDDTGVLTAKKVILLIGLNTKVKYHLWGNVISVSGQTITIQDKSNKNQSILVSSDTDFKSGNDDSTFADIQKNDKILVSGYPNENDIVEATFVYTIPTGPQTPKPSQTASASATPKSTPKASAKPTKTPKPTPTPEDSGQ